VIGNSVKNDLATERDYVQYRCVPQIGALEVYALSDTKNGQPPGEFGEERYYLGEDPLTKAHVNSDEFFRKYGLPVSKREL
jgi:hypothetical protein